MPLINDFKARFPGIQAADADVYVPILELVYQSYYPVEYTESSKEAILNLIAHLMTIEKNPKGGNRVVSSKSVGSVSTSYESAKFGSEFYNTTQYGQRFFRLTAFKYGGVAV